MASLGHVAVGMALGQAWAPGVRLGHRVAAMGFFSVLALLPDADAVGFRFGVRYADEWGHRGASHSLFFATLAAATLAAFIGRAAGSRSRRLFLFAWGALVSHGVLDALTDGGLGAALLWPWSTRRFFFPVQPLPVAPIGLGMLSSRGLFVLGAEALAFSPLLLYALWPRRRPG